MINYSINIENDSGYRFQPWFTRIFYYITYIFFLIDLSFLSKILKGTIACSDLLHLLNFHIPTFSFRSIPTFTIPFHHTSDISTTTLLIVYPLHIKIFICTIYSTY
uniref:Uncharacterized protein n=1 Tax=Schizaphis graminum TaxID=13262 RepID=A0A2S2P838_SCHGA